MQLIDFIETDRNLKVATTNYDTVSEWRGLPACPALGRDRLPAGRQGGEGEYMLTPTELLLLNAMRHALCALRIPVMEFLLGDRIELDESSHLEEGWRFSIGVE